MYQWANDTLQISEQLTAAFLQRLQQQLTDGEADSGQSMLMSPGTNVTELLDVFISLAKDVLVYLRQSRSQALLQMLRDFARRGAISMSDIDPDILQREINELLNATALNDWYGATSRKDTVETQTRPWTTRAAAAQVSPATSNVLQLASEPQQRNSTTLAYHAKPSSPFTLLDQRYKPLHACCLRQLQGTTQLLQGGASTGRRLLSTTQQHTHSQQYVHNRQLQATTTIPVISDDVAAKQSVIPTASELLTLNDMLCAVESYSPTGLTGMIMPTAAEFKIAGVTPTDASGKAIKCPAVPQQLGTFQFGGVVFKPVVIPIVFHCE
jgi:hypothetical protein